MKKIIIVFVLIFSTSFGQKKEGQLLIDSLLVELPKMKEDIKKADLINKLAYAYFDISADKHLKYAKEGLKLSQKLDYNFGVLEANRNFGVYYLGIDNIKANQYFDYVLQNAKDKTQLAKAYLGIGSMYLKESNFPKSFDNYFKGLKLAEEAKNHPLYAKILDKIGVVYLYSYDTKKAILYYFKALNYNKKHSNKTDNNIILQHLAFCYVNFEEYDKALKYINEAEKINDELGLLKFKAACKDLKGHIFYSQGKYELALDVYKKSLQIYLLVGDNNLIRASYTYIAQTYISLASQQSNLNKKKYLLQAKMAISEVIAMTKKANDIRHLSLGYSTLSEIQKLQGNFKEALQSHEQYAIYNDSVFNSDNKETIKNLEDKREIELRDNQIKINKLSLEAKEKQKWYLFGGLGLLTIIGGLLFYQSRKRKQINQKLEILNTNLDAKNLELDQANKAKTRFFGILNHDLRGPVANLVFFLQLQQDSPEMLDQDSIKRMQNKTMTGAENLLSTMEDILQWSKSQMENFKPQPKQIAVNQLFEDTKRVFSGYLKIEFEYQNPNNMVVFTDENYLKTIIRNLTSNAINVFTDTENPKIIWKAWQEANISYFSIQDNGPGASLEQFKTLFEDTEITSAKSGLGLYLIRDMAKAINCEISIESAIGAVTTFTLKF